MVSQFQHLLRGEEPLSEVAHEKTAIWNAAFKQLVANRQYPEL